MEELIKIITETGSIGLAAAMLWVIWQVSNRINETNVNHLSHLQNSMDIMVNELKELRKSNERHIQATEVIGNKIEDFINKK